MASSRVEFGLCVLNRPSTSATTTRYEKINESYLRSCFPISGNSCADFESENWKTQNNVDLSWLPNFDVDNSASESHNHFVENDFDYSWLPDYIDTKTNGSISTAASTSSDSNRSTITEDDSWLPSTPIVNGGIDDSWLPNYDDVKKNISTKPSNPNNSIRPRKTETDSNDSRFSSTSIVTNGNQNKETVNDNNKERKIHQAKPLTKKPESSGTQGQISKSKSEYSVETDSLGGVSTLLRRFQDLAETRKTNRKAKKSFDSNHGKSPLISTESNNNDPSKVVNDSERDHRQVAGDAGENRCFSHVTGKTRLIRGRHAFNDFLKLIEQDKQRELISLAQRKSVSQFSYRGRIRALLRFRFLRLDADPKIKSKTLKPVSTTTFNQSPKGADDHRQIAESKSPIEHVTDKAQEIDTSSRSNSIDLIQLENCDDWISESSQSQSDSDEEDDESYNFYQNWISEIARPKRYWEYMRQARYHEMLYLYTNIQDLRELLQRRCVARFLSSGQRVNIDQWVQSRLERECRKYNECVNETTVIEEMSNVILVSY